MTKATVIVFPGSNCNQEAFDILEKIGFQTTFTWHKDELPQNCDLYFIPGGFSYGDYLRSGAIAGLGKIMQDIKKMAEQGRHIIGVCNGFQILTESKILDGALLRNECGHFLCKTVELQTVSKNSKFTQNIPTNIAMQIAHGDGRYFCDDDTLKKLQDENRIAFQYAHNPNGSLANIAGIFGGKNNNVLGLMPHPERDLVRGTNGVQLFKSLFNLI
jgi:phosphoribosylformylglycinamidine synthase I